MPMNPSKEANREQGEEQDTSYPHYLHRWPTPTGHKTWKLLFRWDNRNGWIESLAKGLGMHCLGKYKLIYSSQLSECFVAHLLLPRASCISQYTDVAINSFSLGPTESKAGLVQAPSLWWFGYPASASYIHLQTAKEWWLIIRERSFRCLGWWWLGAIRGSMHSCLLLLKLRLACMLNELTVQRQQTPHLNFPVHTEAESNCAAYWFRTGFKSFGCPRLWIQKL